MGVILDKTSYYAESGGQIYDTSVIKTGSCTVKVENVQLYGSFVLHVGQVVEGSLSVGESAACSVDYVRRAPIASNHTMTHVLNYALREILVKRQEKEGKKSTIDVDQKGSFQDELKSRFDFSWTGQLSPEQLAEVEKICRAHIEKGVPVDTYVAPLGDAEKISSLRAVFGEKYPDPVRVVAIAHSPITDMLANPSDDSWKEYSVEFCGGTHLTNTSEAEAFALLSEEGIAKGIRRVVFVTKDDAKKAMAAADEFETKIKAAEALEGDALEAKTKVLSVELEGLVMSAVKKIEFREQLGALTKKVIAFKKQRLAGMTDEIKAKAIAAGEATEGDKVVFRFDFGVEGKLAKNVCQVFGKKIKDKAIMLISGDETANRFMVMAMAAKGLDIDCKAWVTAATEGTGGKGRGKKDSAQFTVPDVSQIESVMEKAKKF